MSAKHGIVKMKMCGCKQDILAKIDARIDNLEEWLHNLVNSPKSHTPEDLDQLNNTLIRRNELRDLKKELQNDKK